MQIQLPKTYQIDINLGTRVFQCILWNARASPRGRPLQEIEVEEAEVYSSSEPKSRQIQSIKQEAMPMPMPLRARNEVLSKFAFS